MGLTAATVELMSAVALRTHRREKQSEFVVDGVAGQALGGASLTSARIEEHEPAEQIQQLQQELRFSSLNRHCARYEEYEGK